MFMKEKLSKMKEDNRKLNEMLSDMSMNYNILRNKLLNFINSPPSEKSAGTGSPIRKRKSDSLKSDSYGDANNEVEAHVECLSSDLESYKRLRMDSKSSVSKICVRTDLSEKSLVSI